VRVGYLLLVAVGVFFIRDPRGVVAVAALQLLLWLAAGLGLGRAVSRIRKLWLFAALITLAYALTANDPDTDVWLTLPLYLFDLELNRTGALIGLTMVLRILCVVLASQVARAGEPRAVVDGLSRLGVPASASILLDTVLALVGDSAAKPKGESAAASLAATFRRLRRGDVGPLVESLEGQFARAEAHIDELTADDADRGKSKDLAIIAGIALTMLGIRALKVLPGLPIPAGHKMIFLTPLYVSATLLTSRRFASTGVGLSMGLVSFLMGEGRYGIFGLFKHVAPGLLCDLMLGRLRGGSWRPGVGFWAFFGALAAVARFATMFAVVLAVQAPSVAYALLVPGLVSNVVFGSLSGYITFHLVARLSAPSELSTDGDGG